MLGNMDKITCKASVGCADTMAGGMSGEYAMLFCIESEQEFEPRGL